MLEPWIIEQIRRREEEERRRNERPQLEIPIRDERRERGWRRQDEGDPSRDGDDHRDDKDKDEDQPKRGVMIIEFG